MTDNEARFSASALGTRRAGNEARWVFSGSEKSSSFVRGKRGRDERRRDSEPKGRGKNGATLSGL